VAGSSQEGREQEVHGYTPAVPISSGLARLRREAGNQDRSGGSITYHAVESAKKTYDPYVTFGNPLGKTLQDFDKKYALGGATQYMGSSIGTGAGKQSGAEGARGRAQVKPKAAYANGNVMIDQIITQSKFIYDNYDR
jgi:CobQ-like glutamine amidotransferase family enzyme